jgi:hypothetical protein
MALPAIIAIVDKIKTSGSRMKPVLYVSHSKRGLFYYNDASARYRCVFPAEERIANGDSAHAIHFSQINKIQLDDYRKIIFHRPQYSFKLKRIVKSSKNRKIDFWVDFDDLLFCPELSDSSAAVQSGKMSPALAKKQAKRYLKALRLFRNCQVSTDELAEQLQTRISTFDSGNNESAKDTIKISYNKVPERWVKQAKIIPASERLEKKIIRYLPGTSHHKHDFAHIEHFLAELLHENPSFHLNIIGELEFDTSLFPSKQISQTDFQPYEQLPSLINDSWIIIAPLVDNVFNRCKSGLKFWESGAFGIPVISSPLRDIERFKNKGLCISDDLEEWKQYIHLLGNHEHYSEASIQALQTSNSCIFWEKGGNNRSDYRLSYLTLTAEFGPRWPADWLNPTSMNYSPLNDKEKWECSALTLAQLTRESANQIRKDKPFRKGIFKRKLRKLLNSPVDFFKDSKIF